MQAIRRNLAYFHKSCRNFGSIAPICGRYIMITGQYPPLRRWKWQILFRLVRSDVDEYSRT